MAEFKQLIMDFIQSSGGELAEQDFEDENYCAIKDDDGDVIHVSYNPGQDTLVLMGALGTLPEAELQEEEQQIDSDGKVVLKFFLGCNLLWDQSDGATFAYVAEGNYVVIQRRFKGKELSQETFRQAVEDFSTELRLWINRYAQVLEQVARGDSLDEIELSLDPKIY